MKEKENYLTIKINVKERVHSKGAKIDSWALAQLEKKVDELIERAIRIAEANGRHIVMARDFI